MKLVVSLFVVMVFLLVVSLATLASQTPGLL